VRINAQLIEGSNDGHIWGDRYDRDLSDIFAVQDEIAKTIVELHGGQFDIVSARGKGTSVKVVLPSG